MIICRKLMQIKHQDNCLHHLVVARALRFLGKLVIFNLDSENSRSIDDVLDVVTVPTNHSGFQVTIKSKSMGLLIKIIIKYQIMY